MEKPENDNENNDLDGGQVCVETGGNVLTIVDEMDHHGDTTYLHTPLRGFEWAANLNVDVYEKLHAFMQPMDPLTGCKEWTGMKNAYGYPVFYVPRARVVHVSRIVLFEIGRTPDWDAFEPRWDAHHTCFNKGCVNPYHLMWCTPRFHKELHMIANELKGFNGHTLDVPDGLPRQLL